MKNIAFISILIVLFSCKDRTDPSDPPVLDPATEVITTLKVYFSDSSNSSAAPYIAIFKDPDASGSMPYTVLDTIKLTSHKTYNTKIILLNEMNTPADSVSNEIYQEREQHQFFFQVTGDASGKLTVAYLASDADSNHVPVGLKPIFKTTSPSTTNTGKIEFILRHQPGVKPTSGKGDINLGRTDIQVAFPILIQ